MPHRVFSDAPTLMNIAHEADALVDESAAALACLEKAVMMQVNRLHHHDERKDVVCKNLQRCGELSGKDSGGEQ